MEADETVIVQLTSIASGDPQISIGATDTASLQILDNDSATLSINDVLHVEGDAPGTTVLMFTVSIDSASSGITASGDITVLVNTSGISATGGGVDFADVVNQTVTIVAGATSATVMVNVKRENLSELDETFNVHLSNAQINGASDATRVSIADGIGLGTIKNDDFAPVANAGGPYVINEGGSLTLNASASSDADLPADTLTYRWDVDADGDYDENVTGINPTITLSQLLVLGLADGPRANNVTVMVSDGTNINTAQTTVTVNNVNPLLASLTNSASSCCNAFMGVDTVTIAASFTDVGLLDTHTASINWGDGNVTTATVGQGAGSGTLAGSHAYATGGIFTITVTLTDDDGGSVTSTTTAVITGVGVVGSTLYVIGTDTDDRVTINQTGSVYKVHADFLTTGSFRDVPMAGISRIVVQTCDGNDQVTVSGGVSLPTLIDGGAGDDKLNGGNGPNIVLGGSGNDQINGGSARDILIGG
ncbi:MAG: hypothetical protein IT423_04280, partial [Pirellulaceae bacterium]|nr:hypothetical protein [Pirellulaceae bacterium]